jgi:hypothetical protein
VEDERTRGGGKEREEERKSGRWRMKGRDEEGREGRSRRRVA